MAGTCCSVKHLLITKPMKEGGASRVQGEPIAERGFGRDVMAGAHRVEDSGNSNAVEQQASQPHN